MFATLFCVFDNKANEMMGGVQIQKHDALAIRTFTDAIKHPESRLVLHPDDYELRKLGYINTESGQIDPQTPEVVITAAQIIATLTPENAK